MTDKLTENLNQGIKKDDISLVEKSINQMLDAKKKLIEKTVQSNVKQNLFK